MTDESKVRVSTRRGQTVFVVLQVVIGAGAPELGQVLLVVELQEVGPFATETQEGGRQAPRQGHQAPGAANAEKKCVLACVLSGFYHQFYFHVLVDQKRF